MTDRTARHAWKCCESAWFLERRTSPSGFLLLRNPAAGQPGPAIDGHAIRSLGESERAGNLSLLFLPRAGFEHTAEVFEPFELLQFSAFDFGEQSVPISL